MKRTEEKVVHSAAELAEMIRNMKDTESLNIRITYEKGGEEDGRNAKHGAAVPE